jgi:hypothetical protein
LVTKGNISLGEIQREKEHVAQNIDTKIAEFQRLIEGLHTKKTVKEKQFDEEIVAQHDRIKANQQLLDNARERSKQIKKTKEEIKSEKQIQEVLAQFKKTNPDRDLEYYFPNYKNYLPTTTTVIVSSETTHPISSSQEEKEEEEEDEKEDEKQEDYMSLTPWQKFLRANPSMNLYSQYHKAIEMGITPDISEPEKPQSKRRPTTKTATETISRESLAKFLPSYG